MKNNELGSYLSIQRKKNGFKSQRALAFEAHISPATLSRIEAGDQHPSPETLKQIANCFKGVTYEELLSVAGYLSHESPVSKHSTNSDNYIFLEGDILKLSNEEANYIRDSLDMFRLLQQKKRDSNKNT